MSTARRTGNTPGAASKVDSAREAVSTAVDTLIAQLESGKSEQLLNYLSTMSRFHSYSIGNVMLIMSQYPDATRVAGFHTWKSMGRSVKKGEKGIVIIAPMIFKKDDDAQSGDEEKIVRYRAVHVFDISQTEGEPLPEPNRISGEPGETLARLEAAIMGDSIEVQTVDSLGGADGVSTGGTIRIAENLSEAERFSVLVHEWAHELLHQRDKENRPPKTVRETEAESVAFVVSHACGLKTGTASSDYIQLYNGDRDTLTASLDRIQKTACRIIEAIDEQDGPDPTPSPTPPTPPRDENPTQAIPEEHELEPDRFEQGTFCYRKQRTVGEGDIAASYSADMIALEGHVRRPFTWKGEQWVCIGSGMGNRHKVYKLVDPSTFPRTVRSYSEKTRDAESARKDPYGFYDGMRVSHGKQEYVLCGPQIIVQPGKAQQGELFRDDARSCAVHLQDQRER